MMDDEQAIPAPPEEFETWQEPTAPPSIYSPDFGDPHLHVLHCPVCGNEYMHMMSDPITRESDTYSAWAGRGGVVAILYRCENGWHDSYFCFGFHKGHVVTFWSRSGVDE